MFEKHPGRMRQPLGNFAAAFSRKIGDDLVESRVRVAAIEQFEKMFTERSVGIHGLDPLFPFACFAIKSFEV